MDSTSTKRNILTDKTTQNTTIYIGDTVIEEGDQFCYLGSIMDINGYTQKHIYIRISLA